MSMNNNFKYSVELMQKMSEILKPEIMSIMERDISKAKTEPMKHVLDRRDLMTSALAIAIEHDGPVIKPIKTGFGNWVIAFNSCKGTIIMTACEIESGTTFRYIVNELDDKEFGNVVEYLRMISADNNDKKEIVKNKEND